jgi:hypothetical protein
VFQDGFTAVANLVVILRLCTYDLDKVSEIPIDVTRSMSRSRSSFPEELEGGIGYAWSIAGHATFVLLLPRFKACGLIALRSPVPD